MQFETHLYLKLQNDENRIIQNFFSLKNHFKMMISKLFNIKKKIPCVGEIAHALFGFQHLCDPSIMLPLLWRVLPVWEPNSCSGSPARRPWNPPRGHLRPYFLRYEYTSSLHGSSRVISLYTQVLPTTFVEASWTHQTVEPKFTISYPYFANSNLKRRSPQSSLANTSTCPKKVRALVAQSCSALCDPMDYNPADSPIRGILQARILEWVPIPFSKGSSWSRDQTWVFRIAGGFLPSEPPGTPRNSPKPVLCTVTAAQPSRLFSHSHGPKRRTSV